MTSEHALALLMQNIKNCEDLNKYENRWILHCIYVGLASRRIAAAIGINDEYALIVGYLHDIGRIIRHNNHPIEGYLYLDNLGYPDIARYSLTHSFINNDIHLTAGGGPKDKDSFDFINNYLQNIDLNIYDNIVQLCDLFCLETGFTTIEKRMLDITERKGVFDNSYDHFKSIFDLKEKLEVMMGKDLYSLFPEIKEEDLNNQDIDREKLLELIKEKKKVRSLRK